MTKRPHTAGSRAEGWSPDRFTLARLAADLTYDQLVDRLAARGLPVSRTTVHSWAQGRSPRSEWMPVIADALGVAQRRLQVR